MAAYSLTATDVSQQSPKLKKGIIQIYTSVDIYWVIGEDPVATNDCCALLRAGQSIELRLPVKCSRLAVLAVRESGSVTIIEHNGGARSSCSS
jgi:hypothetical protein